MESKEPTDDPQNDDPSAQILNFPSPEQELEDCVQRHPSGYESGEAPEPKPQPAKQPTESPEQT